MVPLYCPLPTRLLPKVCPVSTRTHYTRTRHVKDLRKAEAPQGLTLSYVIDAYLAYRKAGKTEAFFTRPSWFDLLMGTNKVRLGIIAGKDEATIRSEWQKELNQYKEMRKKYLLYP